MLYKTIVLELLEQRPRLYGQLRKDRKLLATLEIYATQLKERHEDWKVMLLQRTWPRSTPTQIASEALEMAIEELEDRLPPA